MGNRLLLTSRTPILLAVHSAWAASGGHSAIVEALVKHPLADVNAPARGDTPLFLAGKAPDMKSMAVSPRKPSLDPKLSRGCLMMNFLASAVLARGPSATHGCRWIFTNGKALSALHSLCGAARENPRYHRDITEPGLIQDQRGFDAPSRR